MARELEPDVPLHFTAFHPDYHMREIQSRRRPQRCKRRAIAIRNGLDHVYVGNVHDPARQATLCPTCGARAMGATAMRSRLCARRRRRVRELRDKDGRVFAAAGHWGSRRLPVTSSATRREAKRLSCHLLGGHRGTPSISLTSAGIGLPCRRL